MQKREGWKAAIDGQNWQLILLLAVMLLSGIIISPQRSFFPIYVEEQLGYSAVLVSTFVSLGLVWGMVAAVVGGALSDAVSRKGTLILGLLGLMLANLAFLIHVPGLVLVFWAVGGLGLGFHSLGAMGYLIDAANPERLGLFSALYNWGFTLGGALSSPAAGFILDDQGFAVFGLALLVLSLVTVLGAVLFLPRLRRGPGKVSPTWSETLLGYRHVVRRPLVVHLGLMRFLPTCYYGMVSILNPLLINRVTGSKTAVAWYATLSLIMATLAQIVVGRAADRWGSRRPTLATYGVLVVAIAGQGIFVTEVWSYYTFGVLGIAAAWSLSTLMPVLVSDSTAIEERGRVLGTLHLLWNLAMIGGSMLGGALLEISVGLPFAVVALLNLGAILLAVSFFRLVDLQKNRVACAAASD